MSQVIISHSQQICHGYIEYKSTILFCMLLYASLTNWLTLLYLALFILLSLQGKTMILKEENASKG